MISEWYKTLPLDIIYRHAELRDLDPLLICAMIKKESNGNTWAARYEPLTNKYVDKLNVWRQRASVLGLSEQTEYELEKYSWGLMQVMGFVALELGFSGHLTELCTPNLGVQYGCMKLQKLFQSYGDVEKVVSSYNQGSPRMSAGGLFLNQKSYVDPVFGFYRELQKAQEDGALEI